MSPALTVVRRVYAYSWALTTVSASELRERRARLADRLAPGSLALVRGAPAPTASRRFRQTNELLWLTGLEVPHAYVLVEAEGGRTTVYVPRRDEEPSTGIAALWPFAMRARASDSEMSSA